LAVIAAGSVITGVSTTGVIAPGSDVARTGVQQKEYAETGVFIPRVDFKLAMDNCGGAFTDDLDSPMFSVTLDPGARTFVQQREICLKNYGEDPAVVRIRVADIQGSDLTCEPDEGDACGKNGDLQLYLRFMPFTANGCPSLDITQSLVDSNNFATAISADGDPPVYESDGPIEPGMACEYRVDIRPLVDPIPYEQQTDRLEWRFRFSTI
jgi:hypothetical protein